jgi:hypothetical protein
MVQITFGCQPSFEKFARASRREQFLNTMEAVVPWAELEALIEPYYPKAGNRWAWASCCGSTFCNTGSTCRRVALPHPEASLRLYQGALSRYREESPLASGGLGPGQSLPTP